MAPASAAGDTRPGPASGPDLLGVGSAWQPNQACTGRREAERAGQLAGAADTPARSWCPWLSLGVSWGLRVFLGGRGAAPL